MTTPPSIPIALPNIGEEEWLALREPLESGWLTQGPQVAAFESAFAERHGVAHALATTSCTTGLHLILVALGIGPGDEVIVPAFTWVATANVVLYCGATPVFADIDPRTYNLDPEEVSDKVGPRTQAVIAVHLFGLCADMDALRAAVPDRVHLIEDAACAVGSTYQRRSAGTLGTAAAFSFHPRKIITTGEGGMITTNDSGLAERMDRLRNHGAEISEEQRHHGQRPYMLPDFNLLGYNYRMTDLQGAVGRVQLGRLDRLLEERRAQAAWYHQALADIPWLVLPTEPPGYMHVWQAYVTRIDLEYAPFPRNEIMNRLQRAGIATRPGTHAVHKLGLYQHYVGLQPEDLPNAHACDLGTMAIPLHNRLADGDQERIVDALKSIGH